MKAKSPLYNSRIIKNYIEFIDTNYPHIYVNILLRHAGMTQYEVDDPAHWFTQRQVDRFHEIVVKKTGNENISREVGRFAASSKASEILKRYTLGFVTPASAYWLLEKITPHITRGHTFRSRRIGPNKVEVSVTQNPGVFENPQQCDNRIGQLEAIAKVFTNKFAKIEHPTCIHKGGDTCRYVITWERAPSLMWKRIRNYSFILGIIVSAALYVALPPAAWISLVLLFFSIIVTLTLQSEKIEKKELAKTIEVQGDIAKDQLDEINMHYNNALLIREIGQATSTILDIRNLLEAVTEAMEKRLDFDRGGIWLPNNDNTRLIYYVGYGYGPEIENILRKTDFHLDRPRSKGPAVRAFKRQRPYMVNDVNDIREDLSKRTIEFIKNIGTQSFISVPIVYESESLGLLMVDNLRSKRALTQSDMSLLMGIASQIAVSITNANSFQRIQESEERYRTLFEDSRDPIFITTEDGQFVDVNQSMLDLFGYQRGEMIGMNITDIHPHNADRAKVLAELNKGSVRDFETRFTKKDGTEMECLLTATTRRTDDGGIAGYQGIIRDITERKRAEEDRKKLEAQLMQAQKMEAIGTIAGGVAHNFRNILTVISMNSQILQLRYSGDATLQRIAEVLISYVDRGAKLVSGLMQFARKQEKKEFQSLDLASVVQETYELISKSFDKMIDIGISVPESLPIMGDHAGLSQVLMNLCTNASDAMPDGGTLRIEARREAHRALVVVSDTGCGMDKETREKCLDPFFTTKEVNKGTGLGLSTTYGIVKEHGGEIHVHSKVGQGTMFTLSFPIDRSGKLSTHEQVPELSRGEGQKILIVDDESEMCKSMAELLTGIGYRADSVNTGKAAIEKYQAWHPDAVLLDRNMPEMDGISCGEKIMDFDPNAKIVIISGYDEQGPVALDDERKKFIRGYLTKPIDMNELSSMLAQLLK
ncbi:MAG: PAS domain S-box protein [Deltaproteobacteria bacterium]|nr:PAS domain S-box protein [Deltaproteobacteria bacterium]